MAGVGRRSCGVIPGLSSAVLPQSFTGDLLYVATTWSFEHRVENKTKTQVSWDLYLNEAS